MCSIKGKVTYVLKQSQFYVKSISCGGCVAERARSRVKAESFLSEKYGMW